MIGGSGQITPSVTVCGKVTVCDKVSVCGKVTVTALKSLYLCVVR